MRSLDQVRTLIRDVPDFPQPGILFKDITPVIGDPVAFQSVLDAMEERLRGRGFHRIVAVELVKKQQGEVGAFLFVIELAFLKGRERLAGTGAPVEALISY